MSSPVSGTASASIPARADITGLVLAGGQGSRMGGMDKGLQPFHGTVLARHAMERLRPQVGAVAINANRHLDRYAAWQVPVWPDASGDFPGPLAGLLAGLARCTTPWLLTVPCDTPRFPGDLAARMAAAAGAAGASVALAASAGPAGPVPEPVFCLAQAALRDDLETALAGGVRAVRQWASRHACVLVAFDRPGDDPLAFRNANTLAELRALEGLPPPAGPMEQKV